MTKSKLLAICGFALASLIATASLAQDQTTKLSGPKSGWYLGLTAPKTNIGGDFDGTKFVYSSSGDEAVVVPRISSGFGLGVRIGYRGSNMAYELSRVSQTLLAEWLGAQTDVKATTYSLDCKYLTKPFQLSTLPTQFFMLFGMGISSLTVKDGAIGSEYYADDYSYGDGHFTGVAFNFGLGLDVALTERVVASGSLGYRYLYFGGAKGVSGEMLRVQDGIKGSGTALSLGLSYTL